MACHHRHRTHTRRRDQPSHRRGPGGAGQRPPRQSSARTTRHRTPSIGRGWPRPPGRPAARLVSALRRAKTPPRIEQVLHERTRSHVTYAVRGASVADDLNLSVNCTEFVNETSPVGGHSYGQPTGCVSGLAWRIRMPSHVVLLVGTKPCERPSGQRSAQPTASNAPKGAFDGGDTSWTIEAGKDRAASPPSSA